MLIRLLLTFSIFGIAFSQPSPKDVFGWGKLRWGMTVDQARAAYGSEAQKPDGENSSTKYVPALEIKSLMVGATQMQAVIETMPGSNRISEVTLSMPEENFKAGSVTRSNVYQDILNALTLKYGKPTRQERNSETTLTDTSADWVFPSTVIRLQSIGMKLGFGLLNLQYESVNKKIKDVL